MGRFQIFVLFVLFLATVSSQYRTDDISRKGVLKKLCGMYLTKELSSVCKGNYNTLKIYRKRSVDDSSIISSSGSESEDQQYPFLSKEVAKSFTKTKHFRRRLVRGVVNECCDKPCSYDELRSYCAEDSTEQPPRRS